MNRILRIALFAAFAVARVCSADAQSQDRCTANACYGYGPPQGSCNGAFIFSDISASPVQAYACKNFAWTPIAGAGGGLPAGNGIVAVNGGVGGLATAAQLSLGLNPAATAINNLVIYSTIAGGQVDSGIPVGNIAAATPASVIGFRFGAGGGPADLAATNTQMNNLAAPDVANVTLEFPYVDNVGNALVTSGTTVTDVSGSGNNGTLGTSTNAPTQYTYGLAFLDTGTATTPYQVVTTPLTTWLTWAGYVCPPAQVTTTGTATGGTPSNSYPSLLGSTNSTAGLDILSYPYTVTNYAGAGGNPNQPTIFNAATGATVTAPKDAMTGCGVIVITLGTSGTTTDHIYYQDDNGKNGFHEVQYASQGASAGLVAVTGGSTYSLGVGKGTNNSFGWRGVRLYDEFTSTFSTAAQAQQLAQHILASVKARTTYPTYPILSTSRAATIVCAGDSISAGYLGYNWCNSLTTNNTYAQTNEGIGGSTSLETVKDSALKWERDVVKGNTYLVYYAVTNDALNNFTVVATENAASEAIIKAHKAGAKIILSSMISRTGNAGVGGTFDAFAQSYNAYWRQNWQKQGADGWFDPAAFAVFGASGAYSNTSCFNSGVHPTGTSATSVSCGAWGATTALSGYGIFQYTMQALINSLDGATATSPTVTVSNAYSALPADSFIQATPTAAATLNLQEACGRNSLTQIINLSSFAITVSAVNSETISGSATIAANSIATYVPEITGGPASTTGGCYWLRTQ